MSHTYVSVRIHCIFSTKDRKPLITREMQPRLWAYLGGIARNLKVKVFAIGGIEDHMHVLFALPPTLPLSKVVQTLKANSSKWVNEQVPGAFAWQEGYGAFSVSISHMDATIEYIQNQAEHHKKKTFDEEFAEILRKHGLS
jgi:REP element-mobilizing transposase RayT